MSGYFKPVRTELLAKGFSTGLVNALENWTKPGGVALTDLEDISSDRLLGRDTAGTGSPEELTVGGGIEFTGSGGIRTTAFTGDVTKAAGGTVLTIANDAVTFAKMQNITTDRLIGRDTASSGDPEEISVSGGLEFTGSGGIQRSALSGDASASAGSNTLTLATVNANVGSFGSSTQVGTFTVNAKGLITAASNVSISIQSLLDGISTTQGAVLYYNGTDWVALSPGTAGYALVTNGAGANPSWSPFAANAYVPVTDGAEPPSLISNGAGQLVLVPYSPP